MGGGAKVEAEGVGGADPVARGDAVELGEVTLGEDQPLPGRAGEAQAGSGDRGGILVDGKDPPGRADPVQKRGGDAAAAQGPVDGHLAFTGLQVLYERCEEDRPVEARLRRLPGRGIGGPVHACHDRHGRVVRSRSAPLTTAPARGR